MYIYSLAVLSNGSMTVPIFLELPSRQHGVTFATSSSTSSSLVPVDLDTWPAGGTVTLRSTTFIMNATRELRCEWAFLSAFCCSAYLLALLHGNTVQQEKGSDFLRSYIAIELPGIEPGMCLNFRVRNTIQMRLQSRGIEFAIPTKYRQECW